MNNIIQLFIINNEQIAKTISIIHKFKETSNIEIINKIKENSCVLEYNSTDEIGLNNIIQCYKLLDADNINCNIKLNGYESNINELTNLALSFKEDHNIIN